MKSPFKFLDPYELEDRDAFFGRDAETKELYNLVTKNRLTFVYGPSGTGKTSLVQCGLANRFGGVDWLPVFVRRGENINEALRRETGKALGEGAAFEGDFPAAVGALFNRYLRPVYLIFDQFEELFILGSAAEQQTFYDTIAELLEAELPCRILFILREDYFGHLNQFEKTVPELYHRKLRVEPMSRDNLRAVVAGSCKVFDIGFDDARRSPELIMDNILADKSGIHMPYVQVYLHMLYQEAAKEGLSPLRFTDAVIRRVGPITDVLGRFLQEQKTDIFKTLQQNPAFDTLPEDVVSQVLDVFVSKEGTKAPVGYALAPDGRLTLSGEAARVLAVLPPALVSATIRELEKSRILRRSDDALELAHDTLAALIDQQRSAEQRQLRDIRQRIETGCREHADSGGVYFFDKGQLARIEPFLPKLVLEPEQADFLENSRAEAERLENAEKERVARELRLAEDKLATEERARKRQRFFTWVIGAVALLAVAASVFAYFKKIEADDATIAAEKSATDAQKAEQTAQDSAAVARTQRAAAVSAEAKAKENLALAKENEVKAKNALIQADQNLILTKKEEANAKAAFEQVKKEKAATEEQRKLAEDNYRIAQQKTMDAETSAKEAKKQAEAARLALLEQQKALADVVRLTLKEAYTFIYRLDYESALEKLHAAVALNAAPQVVSDSLLEIVYYFAETGKIDRAIGVLDTAAQLAGREVVSFGKLSNLQDFRKAIETLSPARLVALDARYFPTMLDIPGGTDTLGSDLDDDGNPRHAVTLSAFKLAKTETTWWQYNLFCEATGKEKPEKPVGWGGEGDNPVINVNWYDAVRYANWLSSRAGRDTAIVQTGGKYEFRRIPGTYRLPTEAEWEYAARAGQNFRYAGTNEANQLGEFAWFGENSGSRTRTTGAKKPNAWGLYDMSGNLNEWCWDWLGKFPENPEKDYSGPDAGSFRAIRGGCWYDFAESCQTAIRGGVKPDSFCGFRLVFVP
ncbi:MAG: SUMF1/EgtB/PvdO family nonheme iron enzyme [Saprospiraceae bacterium]